MRTLSRRLPSPALLVAAGLCLASVPGFAASDVSAAAVPASATARMQLSAAFSAAREFRPRSDRSLYELGREDAEAAMRAADARAVTKADRALAGDIHRYFSARDACRLAETVNEYGTCEARVSEKLGEKIAMSLRNTSAREAARATVIAEADRPR